MTNGSRTGFALVAGLLALPALSAAASPGSAQTGEPEGVALASASRLWLEGGSTLGEWTCEATRLEGSVRTAGGEASQVGAALPRIEGVVVHVPVKEIRCGKAPMERDLYRALRADLHPVIEFSLARSHAKEAVDGAVPVTVAGSLSVAGTTRPVELEVLVGEAGRGELAVRGTAEVRMTEFGISPPTAFFGLLRADERLRVRFDLRVPVEELAEGTKAREELMADCLDEWKHEAVGSGANGGRKPAPGRCPGR